MPPPLHQADKMTGQQVYVLNTTPTTSVPLSSIQMDIELKPYAMLPNLPSEYEVDLFRRSASRPVAIAATIEDGSRLIGRR
jgi:hypothetical protein